MNNTRHIAAQALLKVERRGAWSNLTLDSHFQKYNLDARDSAFCSALFYGVLERRLTLDACIAAHSRLRPEKLDEAVRCALRVSLYQLLYMEGVPERAAVSEGVELVRRLRKTQATGYVNGVLRSFLRAGKQIPLPKQPLEARLSVEYSCPAPLIKRWLDCYGEEDARRILEQSLGRPPLYIRVNSLRTTTGELAGLLREQGVDAQADPDLEHCLLLQQQGGVQGLAAYREGLLHVQDKASQLCARALGAEPGMRVLDACAAPGGKTFTIAQAMENTGEIVACDLHGHRAGLIARRAEQMGLSNIRTVVADMSIPQEGLGEFDRVLCDVPCSGLGVIRRRPEIKYKALEEFKGLPDIQYKLLENTAHYCKVGGKLLYSTCTLLPEENGGVTARFVQEHPEFARAELPALPGQGVSAERTLIGALGADGFYMACLERIR